MKTSVFLFIALLTSGSALIPDQEVNRNVMPDKKLELLEKLEAGKRIDREDIWSSFADRHENDICLPADWEIVFSHDDMEKLNESVKNSMETIKREISGLKNSEEFKRAMDEIRKGSEEIRKELEKMREEIRMSDRRTSEWENGS
jgi:DnaJ-domain-containing protein 1